KKRQKVAENADSEETERLESYRCKKDDDKHEEAQDHPLYDVHDSEDEGNEEDDGGEEGTQGKGESEEVNTKDQLSPSLTKEQIEEAIEREVVGIIRELV
ncbi:hypothetical protein KI387_028868, partial [Taxus chinensis]